MEKERIELGTKRKQPIIAKNCLKKAEIMCNDATQIHKMNELLTKTKRDKENAKRLIRLSKTYLP